MPSFSQPGEFLAAVRGGAVRVTPENVLALRDTLQDEHSRLYGDLNLHSRAATHIPALGGDPVSDDASAAFSARAKLLVDNARTYLDDLAAAARALHDIAVGYRLDEDDITGTLHGIDHGLSTPTDASGARNLVLTNTIGPAIESSAPPAFPGDATTTLGAAAATLPVLAPTSAPPSRALQTGYVPGMISAALDQPRSN